MAIFGIGRRNQEAPPEETPEEAADPAAEGETPETAFEAQGRELLEREKNLSKNESINKLIDSILANEFELNMRQERFRELHGNNFIGRAKAYLDGEGRWVPVRDEAGDIEHLELQGGDFCYTEEDTPDGFTRGTIRHNRANEITRRSASVVLKTARTAGLSVAIGLVTGGLGATFVPALVGSLAGRGGVEIVRAGASRERYYRERLEIARVQYFKQCRELASRVGHAYAPEITPLPEDQYDEQRNQAIKDMVNFVYSYEHLAVNAEYDEDGNPYVQNEVMGDPLTPRGEIGDPRPGDETAPAFHRGTELRQPSANAPDFETIGSLEEQLHGAKKVWNKWSDRGAVAGGIIGVATNLLQGWGSWSKDIYDNYTQQLQSGEAVKLDIDGNFRGHDVQLDPSGVQEQYNYHLRSLGEQFNAVDAGATIDTNASEFGSHVLNETHNRIRDAVYQKACNETIMHTFQTLGAILGEFGLARLANIGNEKNNKGYLTKLESNQEDLRKDLQPDTIMDQIRAFGRRERLLIPANGDTWSRVDPEDPERRELIRIISINENGTAEVADITHGRYGEAREIGIRDIMTEYRKLVENTPPDLAGAEGEATAEDEPIIDREFISEEYDDYITAADHKNNECLDHANEAYFFEMVRGSEQLMISISNQLQRDPESLTQLKALAANLRDRYNGLGDVNPENMQAVLESVSAEVGNADNIIRDFSWTMVVTTAEGKYYGLRFNGDKSQLFHAGANGSVSAPSITRRMEGGKPVVRNNVFFKGELKEDDSLALLDDKLSSTAKGPIKQARDSILSSAGTHPSRMAKELIDAGIRKDNKSEYNALITKFKKKKSEADADTTTESEDEPTFETTLTFIDDDGKETKTLTEIKDGTVLVEQTDESGVKSTKNWEIRFEDDTFVLAAFTFNPDTSKKYSVEAGDHQEFDDFDRLADTLAPLKFVSRHENSDALAKTEKKT